jgi:outer membrane lipoprotein SlyB
MKTSRLYLVAALVGITTLSGCASGPRMQKYNVTANVINIEKAQDCYDRKEASTGSTLVGALIGGVIGNQFGSGNGRKIATVAGAAMGAKIGSADRKLDKMQCDRISYDVTYNYFDPITRQMLTDTKRFEKKPRAKRIQLPVYRRAPVGAE